MLLKSIAAASLLLSVLLFLCLDTALWLVPVLFAGIYLVLVLLAFGFLCLICALVDMEKPIPKTEFIRKIQLAHDISRTKARELFEEALAAGYLKYGQSSGSERANNAVKLVLKGDVDPSARQEEEADEEETWNGY